MEAGVGRIAGTHSAMGGASEDEPVGLAVVVVWANTTGTGLSGGVGGVVKGSIVAAGVAPSEGVNKILAAASWVGNMGAAGVGNAGAGIVGAGKAGTGIAGVQRRSSMFAGEGWQGGSERGRR